jgi:general secretion pathway protein A
LYETFYKLNQNPFRLTPDPSFICLTVQHQEALSGLVYSVCTRPGLTVLTGEAGTGKTTLLYSLLDLLEKRRFITALCNNPTMTREEFYDFLLLKLGVECSSPLKSRQLVALQEALMRMHHEGRPAVLIVDEAQRLPMDLLEEVRLLLNLETPREKLLQIIMAGQPELTEVLRRPALRQLKQRISCICKLEPLSYYDLQEYLQHRLTRAGLPTQSLFPEPAMQFIYQLTGGIPRLVNTLCDAALQTGFSLQAPEVTRAILEEAATDLDLGPEIPVLGSDGRMVTMKAPVHEEPPAIAAIAKAAMGDIAKPAAARRNGAEADPSVPLENYTTRQKSLGFLGSLVDRWR